MTVRDMARILDARVLTGEARLDAPVQAACGSDMMSDVLAFARASSVLLTGLVNPQVVRTAQMMDMRCVVFVHGKQPDEEIIRLAERLGLPLLATAHPMYTACGMLYAAGLGRTEPADG